MSYPLNVRKNLKDNEAARDAHLAKLATITGVTGWTIEFTPEYYQALEALKWHERVGQLVYNNILGGVVTNLEKHLKDDMVKEAFVEKVSAKKIVLATEAAEHSSAKSVFADGAFKLLFTPRNANCNVDKAGADYSEWSKQL